MIPLRRAIAVPLALVLLGAGVFHSAPSLAQKGRERSQDAAGGPLWRGWEAGLGEAGRTRRPVLVDFHTDWSAECRRMHRDTYSRPEVREYVSDRFVPVKVNPESSPAARAVANRFRVTSYPTTVFLKPNGDHLVTVPLYVPPGRFRLLLRYVAEGHIERQVPFEEFRRRAEEER